MGIFSFFKKDSTGSALQECTDELLKLYSVTTPSQATTFRYVLGVAIISVGILNEISKGTARSAIDKVSDEAYSLVKDLTFRVSEVAMNSGEQQAICERIPDGTLSTKINGGVAFPCLFNLLGPPAVNDIFTKSGGPLGSVGYSAIVLSGLLSRDSKDKFMETTLVISTLAQKLMKSI